MKLLFDLFPVILFFIAYKLHGIYVATGVAILAAFVQVSYFYWRHRRFEKMHLVSLGLIAGLGGLTLLLQDKAFVMWKPTLLYWVFALVFLLSPLGGRKTLLQRMLESQIQVPAPIWSRGNLAFVAFCVFLGFANLYVALDYKESETRLLAAIPTLSAEALESLDCSLPELAAESELCEEAHEREEFWVNFKLFGMSGMFFAFFLGLAFWLVRYMPDEPEPESGEPDAKANQGDRS